MQIHPHKMASLFEAEQIGESKNSGEQQLHYVSNYTFIHI